MADEPPAAPKEVDAPEPKAAPARPSGARPKKAPAPRPKPAQERAPPTAEPKPAPRPKKAPVPPVAAPKPAPVPVIAGTVVDASGLVLGRAASRIAKRLLNGESIIVVNAEKSVVTGSRASVLEFYRANRARGSKRTGPHYPRYPDRIFRRTVRGMLPHLKTRGRVAFDRLEVHIGVPPALAQAARQSIDDARARPALRTPLTLEEISRLLGARV